MPDPTQNKQFAVGRAPMPGSLPAPVGPATEFMPSVPEDDPNPVYHTVSRDAWERQLPTTEWRHSGTHPSMWTELKGEQRTTVLPDGAYAVQEDYGRESGVRQRLISVLHNSTETVRDGEAHSSPENAAKADYMAIVGISETPRYGVEPESEAFYVVRIDPTGRRGYGQQVVARIPEVEPGDDGIVIGRGRLEANPRKFPDPSAQLSGRQFAAGVRMTPEGRRVVITDVGSSNDTTVWVPNVKEFSGHGRDKEQKLHGAWGGARHWALGADLARDLRPSRMRPMPAESAEDETREPERVRLHGTEAHVNSDKQWVMGSRRDMRLHYGIDAALVAKVVLSPDSDHAESVYVLDRGDMRYGEECSLYDGGPLLDGRQRYVLADQQFMDAAWYASRHKRPGDLVQHANGYGGVKAVDGRATRTVELGTTAWPYVFGDEAANRVRSHGAVAASQVRLTFGFIQASDVTIAELGAAGGARVEMGPPKTASVLGGAAMGGAVGRSDGYAVASPAAEAPSVPTLPISFVPLVATEAPAAPAEESGADQGVVRIPNNWLV